MAAKKKEKRVVLEGHVYIQATFNNTIVTVTDRAGNGISWASAGQLGFRGAKKINALCGTNHRRDSRAKSCRPRIA